MARTCNIHRCEQNVAPQISALLQPSTTARYPLWINSPPLDKRVYAQMSALLRPLKMIANSSVLGRINTFDSFKGHTLTEAIYSVQWLAWLALSSLWPLRPLFSGPDPGPGHLIRTNP